MAEHDQHGRILVVDDDDDVLAAARLLLDRHFDQVDIESDPGRLPDLLAAQTYDVVLLDMNFELGANTGKEGFHWLEVIKATDRDAVVLLMTAYGSVDTAVRAMKAGAHDFVLKPWQNKKLVATVGAALRLRDSRREVARLGDRQRGLIAGMKPPVQEIIGASAAMQAVFEVVRRAAPTQANVLILGENGTGKELIAREIHRLSGRRGEVFLSVDLGAISETLFESELFGHKKGAFTDAMEDRVGRLQAASGGTLFLDEIGNLPIYLQRKLLGALEQRQVTPVGGTTPLAIDIRLICATNVPRAELDREEVFRQDLLYRINTVEVELPPLRDRRDDIPALLQHFIAIYARKYNMGRKRLSAGALAKLRAHHWPGNVRALRHAVERAMILSQEDVLGERDFTLAPPSGALATAALDVDSYNLETVERAVIRRVLAKHSGNVSRTAKELGLTRTSLYRRMEKFDL